MECMDFIILKVNGTDVSSSTHADAVREFLAADEPIVVEVIRRVSASNAKQTPTSSEEHSEPRSCSSTTSSICNETTKDSNQFETATSFNVESPIYTNKSIIDEQTTTQNGQYIDMNGGSRSRSPDDPHDDEPDEEDEEYEAREEDVDIDEILYQNGCIVNKCIGCEYCQISAEQCSKSQQTVSRSVQTHLTALNWLDEIEDCLYHINLEEVMARKSSSEGSGCSVRDAAIVENHSTNKDFHELTTSPSPCPWYQQHATTSTSPSEQMKIGLQDNAMQTVSTMDEANGANAKYGSEEYLLDQENNSHHQILGKSPTNSFIRTQLQSINEQIAELDNRMHKIHIVNSKKTKLVNSSGFESEDCEHIYETIQESEIEPIYSSPYDPDSDIIVQRTLTSVSVDKKKRSKHKSISTTSSNSGNSGDGLVMVQLPASSGVGVDVGGDGDSSSAYNTGTGGSSNSNHHTSTALTFKLGCNHTNRSILQLCSPSHYRYDNLTPKVSSNRKNGGSMMHNSKSLPSAQIAADTMYTNMANLHQTILLQQQLFRQALNQQRQVPFSVRSNTSSTFPGAGATTIQSTSNHNTNSNRSTPATNAHHQRSADKELKMEWKVKRRQNGTRYIARRPIRNRILRNRTKEIIEERAAEFTTEDDTCSEIKIGRYWTKEERKRQILERERKNNKNDSCKNCVKCGHHRVSDTNTLSPDATRATEPTTCGLATTSSSFSGTPSTVISAPSFTIKNKKSLRKKSHKDTTITDDFKTVQDMIVNGGQRPTNSSASKMIGLLSVTTV